MKEYCDECGDLLIWCDDCERNHHKESFEIEHKEYQKELLREN